MIVPGLNNVAEDSLSNSNLHVEYTPNAILCLFLTIADTPAGSRTMGRYVGQVI
jgi:hypothetical protein